VQRPGGWCALVLRYLVVPTFAGPCCPPCCVYKKNPVECFVTCGLVCAALSRCAAPPPPVGQGVVYTDLQGLEVFPAVCFYSSGRTISLVKVEIPSSGIAAHLCDLPENASVSVVTAGTVGKRRLLAGPGSEAMSVGGVSPAFGLCLPVPSDGSSLLSFDLDPEMVRKAASRAAASPTAPPSLPLLCVYVCLFARLGCCLVVWAASAGRLCAWRCRAYGRSPFCHLCMTSSAVPGCVRALRCVCFVVCVSAQSYDCFDAVVGLHDGPSGLSTESKEGEGEAESKSGDAAPRSVIFEVRYPPAPQLPPPLNSGAQHVRVGCIPPCVIALLCKCL
jgi:hypothetical protein